MSTVRTETREWHDWVWVVVGMLAALLVLAMVTRTGGESVKGEPAFAYIACSWDGVFYAGKYFGDEPYVRVGSPVEPETLVGTVEGMRRFDQAAGVRGRIIEVLVIDSQMVYMGQPLFKVQLEPDPKPE